MELEGLRGHVIVHKETKKATKKLIKEIKILKKEEKKYLSLIKKEKEKKLKSLKKYRGSEEDINLYNEGFMKTESNNGYFELIDNPTATPYIETYDETMNYLENVIFLRAGNRTGLFLEVNKTEEINVELNHDATIKKLDHNDFINIKNPSDKNKIRDIEIIFKNNETTHLNSNEVKIQELDVVGQNNVYSQNLQADIIGDLPIIKEYINTFPDADNILNLNDIDLDIQEIMKENYKIYKNSVEPDSQKYQMEHFKVPIDEKTKVTFAIAIYNPFRFPIKNIQIIKDIPEEFTNLCIWDTLWGIAEIEEDQLIWTIDLLPPDMLVTCKFICEIVASKFGSVKTGPIIVKYKNDSYFFHDITIKKFTALTDILYRIEKLKREGADEIWDYKLILENKSEFMIKLLNVNLSSTINEFNKYPLIEPNNFLIFPPGSQWHSKKWDDKKLDLNQYKLELEYTVIPYFKIRTLGQILITDAELFVEMNIQDD